MSERGAETAPRFQAVRAWLAIGLVAAASAIAYLLGAFTPVDRFLSDQTFALHARPASGNLVLVAIDPKSLQKLSTWPWSRAYHAALIQRLVDAGAARIGFDVDFGSASSPEADAALAASIKASEGRVVLATFFQSDNDGHISQSIPAPMVEAGAALGVVNAFADSDGRLRNYRLAEDRLPSSPEGLASVLAAPVKPQDNTFTIDFSIDPESIPRLSYVDVLTGQFDPRLVAGKVVLVGAMALELGDRYPVPVHGFIPGVQIQALAYESLMLDRTIHPAGQFWVLAGLALIGLAGPWWLGGSWRRIHLVTLGGAAGALAIGATAQIAFATAISVAPWLAVIAVGYVSAVVRDARVQAGAALRHRAVAARQKALMQGVFHDSFDGIVVVDRDGRVELANEAAGRILDADPARLVGCAVDILLPGIALAPEAAGAPLPDITVRTAVGRDLALAVAVTRSQPAGASPQSGEGVWIVTFRDETARYALEAAREQVIKELQAASSAKHEFLARISHELRTPLSAIIGFSAIISDQSMGPVGNPKYVEYARDISSGGKRLLELVNDIIDVVRIEAGQFEIRPDVFEARSLLVGCSAQAQAIEGFGGRSLKVEVMPGAEAIRSDRQALGRAIAKLLDNAVKFTGPKGSIALRALPGEDRAVVIEVQDDGVGIAEPALKQVVGAFSQVAGGLNRSHEGTGLGLHLAHRIMVLLGGRLEIESQPGAGTIVRLHLKDAQLEASEAA